MNMLLNALMSNQSATKINVDDERLGQGSVVVVRSSFGMEPPEVVTLTGFTEEGKNNRNVIDYIDKSGDGRWAYTDQIVRVISY